MEVHCLQFCLHLFLCSCPFVQLFCVVCLSICASVFEHLFVHWFCVLVVAVCVFGICFWRFRCLAKAVCKASCGVWISALVATQMGWLSAVAVIVTVTDLRRQTNQFSAIRLPRIESVEQEQLYHRVASAEDSLCRKQCHAKCSAVEFPRLTTTEMPRKKHTKCYSKWQSQTNATCKCSNQHSKANAETNAHSKCTKRNAQNQQMQKQVQMHKCTHKSKCSNKPTKQMHNCRNKCTNGQMHK